MIFIKEVNLAYGHKKIFEEISETIGPRDRIALVGSNGSGKTTFLHLLAGILSPDKGLIVFDGTEVSKLNESARDHLRASDIGYVFQSFNLLQGLNCFENVMMAMAFADNSDESRAKELLDRVGLSHRLNHYPSQLSIGQQQRVALARALANRPKLVLADEPTGNLDPALSAEIMQLFEEFNQVGVTVLIASHDLILISKLRHRIITLSEGRLVTGGAL